MSAKSGPLSTDVVCEDCIAGRYIDDDSTAAEHHVACKTCAIGHEFTPSQKISCSICPAGKYQNSSDDDFAKCHWCPSGRVLIDQGTTPAEHKSIQQCLQCTIGREFKNVESNCQVCPAGKYQDIDKIDSATCKSCPKGRVLVNVGTEGDADISFHDGVEDCIRCSLGRGFKDSVSLCHVCTAGRYQNYSNVDGATCKLCPSARYLVNNGTEVIDIQEHTSLDKCLKCKKGREFIDSFSSCLVCQGGRYQDSSTSDELACKKCQSGKFLADNRGQDAEDKHDDAGDCIDCDDDAFSNDGARFCRKCPAGFRTITVSTGTGTGTDAGATSETTCDKCPAGYMNREEGSSTCDPCLAGSYQGEPGQPFCLPCIPVRDFLFIF